MKKKELKEALDEIENNNQDKYNLEKELKYKIEEEQNIKEWSILSSGLTKMFLNVKRSTTQKIHDITENLGNKNYKQKIATSYLLLTKSLNPLTEQIKSLYDLKKLSIYEIEGKPCLILFEGSTEDIIKKIKENKEKSLCFLVPHNRYNNILKKLEKYIPHEEIEEIEDRIKQSELSDKDIQLITKPFNLKSLKYDFLNEITTAMYQFIVQYLVVLGVKCYYIIKQRSSAYYDKEALLYAIKIAFQTSLIIAFTVSVQSLFSQVWEHQKERFVNMLFSKIPFLKNSVYNKKSIKSRFRLHGIDGMINLAYQLYQFQGGQINKSQFITNIGGEVYSQVLRIIIPQVGGIKGTVLRQLLPVIGDIEFMDIFSRIVPKAKL